MGVKFTELPEDNQPTRDDIIATVDNTSFTSRSTTIGDAVDAGVAGNDTVNDLVAFVGDADISGLGQTVTEAILQEDANLATEIHNAYRSTTIKGNGNAVTSVSRDASAEHNLVVTKGETFTTKAQFDQQVIDDANALAIANTNTYKTVSTQGSGNAITSLARSGSDEHVLVANKGETFTTKAQFDQQVIDDANALAAVNKNTYKSVSTQGSGNAITSLTRSGSDQHVLVANKGTTFALPGQIPVNPVDRTGMNIWIEV